MLRDALADDSTDALSRQLLEAAPDAMVIVDERGTIQLVNAQTEALFGYARAELLGHPVEMLIPARFRAAHPAHRQGFPVALARRPRVLRTLIGDTSSIF